MLRTLPNGESAADEPFPESLEGLEVDLTSVARATSDAIAIEDAEGRILWVNSGWQKMTGYTLAEAAGSTARSLLHGPDTDPRAAEHMAECRREGKPFSVDVLNYRKDGASFWVNLNAQPIADGAGAVRRYLAMAHDISDRKAAEARTDAALLETQRFAEALAASRQQLEMILHGANLGEWIWDITERSLVVNDDWLAGIGLEFEPNRSLKDVLAGIHPDDRDRVVQTARRQAALGTGTLEVEFRVRDTRGTVRWVLARGRVVEYSDDGSPRRLMGTMLDISHRKRMEEDLRAERALLQNILSTIPMAVYWRDASGALVGCNERFTKLTGISATDAIDPDAQTDARFILMSSERDRQVLETGVPILDSEESFLDGAGNRRFVLSSHAPLLTSTGETYGVIGVFTDVTATKQLEAQLSTATRLEAIGQLAAGIAHEINTPMQYIGDNAQFLGKAFQRIDQTLDALDGLDPTDPNLAGAVADLQQVAADSKVGFLRQRIPGALESSGEGVDAVSRIVRAMKDFSHPGADSMEFCDLNAAIQTTIVVAKNEWKYFATVDLDLDDSLPLLPCLPGEINQALLNVVVNAAHAIRDHHTGDELGRIQLSTRRTQRSAVVTITDDGGGIAPDVIDRIFEPFFTTKPVGQGTGQGLAITHQIIVNRHSGHIDVDSVAGSGTTFTITLPLTQDRMEPKP